VYAARVSRPRLSSHHRDIDKDRYPDIGMRGQVVREKLHGRTATGTWVQLEKTPAAFGQRKVPSLTDIRHLIDYVVYRLMRSCLTRCANATRANALLQESCRCWRRESPRARVASRPPSSY
jgi:hypothetical protein